MLVSRRDLHSLRRAEPWVLAAVQIGYAASVVLFAPAYIDLLELTWPVYNAYAVSVSPFRFETLAVAAGIAGVFAWPQTRGPSGRFCSPFVGSQHPP